MPTYDPNNDTYSAKGFVSFGAATNNAADQVAALGELSVRSETYSKDRLIFGGAAGSTPDTSVSLTVFSSRNTADGASVAVASPYAEMLVQIGQWSYRQAINGDFTSDPEIYRQQILAEFTTKLADVDVGPMVQQGTMFLPEYVIFYLNKAAFTGYDWTPHGTLYDQSRFKLWFSDEAFQNQYDEYVIEFVAPITNLDDFFLLTANVRTNVEARTMPQWMDLIQAKAGEDPYTILKTMMFKWYDPNDEDRVTTINTNWSFLIYGAAGDNIDAIKSELAAWILANSTHTREEWVVIFPDIFTSTEFIVTPLWTQYSVPNKTLDPGVYSPVVNVPRAQMISHTTCTGTNYNNTHIDVNLAVVSCLYKSVALLIVGGPENIDGKFKFQEKWPDYMAVPTSSPDFNRMQPATQALVNKLYELLQAAEEMTEFSDVPPGITRLKRVNGAGETILYAVASIDNVQYLVVSKNSMERYYPVTADPTALALSPSPSVTLNTPTGSKRLQINISATGGVGPYHFTATSADISSGAIDPNTGYLDVIFTNFGSNTIDVTVTDALENSFTGTYSVFSDEGL